MREVEILTSNGVNVKQSLEYFGDMATYDEMLGDFLTEMENRVVELENYKAAGDMPNYAILVHAIKSDSKYLGFSHLAELALQHEMESKSGNVEFVNSNYNTLKTEIDRIIDVAQKYLNS